MTGNPTYLFSGHGLAVDVGVLLRIPASRMKGELEFVAEKACCLPSSATPFRLEQSDIILRRLEHKIGWF